MPNRSDHSSDSEAPEPCQGTSDVHGRYVGKKLSADPVKTNDNQVPPVEYLLPANAGKSFDKPDIEEIAPLRKFESGSNIPQRHRRAAIQLPMHARRLLMLSLRLLTKQER